MSPLEQLSPAPGRQPSPALQAIWLETRNRFNRNRVAALLATLLVGLGLGAVAAMRWGPALSAAGRSHLLATAMVVALLDALLTHHGRLRWTLFYRRGWLATVPMSRTARAALILLRSTVWPLVLGAGQAAVVLVSAAASGESSTSLLVTLAIGTVLGIATGWWLPGAGFPTTMPLSTLARVSAPDTAGLAALSRWPLLQTRAWLLPRTVARLFFFGLILPLNMPANVALALWALLLITVYLVVLLRATVHIAWKSAAFLKPTPVSFGRFAWSVAWLPLVKQLQWTAAGLLLLVPLGVQPRTALRITEIWLAAGSVITSTALACARQDASWRNRILVSFTLLGIADSIREYLLLPCALGVCSWQLRKATRP